MFLIVGMNTITITRMKSVKTEIYAPNMNMFLETWRDHAAAAVTIHNIANLYSALLKELFVPFE